MIWKKAGSDTGFERIRHTNAIVVDRVIVILCAFLSVLVLVMYLFTRIDLLSSGNVNYGILMAIDELLLVASIIVGSLSEDRRWSRYLFIAVLMFTALIISSTLSLPYLLFAIPIVVVTAYYDSRFTIAIAAIGALLMCVEPFLSSYLGIIDLNYCDFAIYSQSSIIIKTTPLEEATRKLLRFTVPSLLIYAAITSLSVWVTSRGLSLARDNVAMAETNAAMEHELSIASDIQCGMLPTNFPDTDYYRVSANMRPAKEVGGDFYDYINVGTSSIAFLVADVSGKGIPAALFMASARTLIRSNIANGLPVDVALDRANTELLKTNKEKLFVTVWVATLDLSTGTLSFVNAGHNPPFIIHADGSVDELRSKPNFVLGRKKGIKYREQRLTLSPGDRVFLYTDGLTDSTNKDGEMFGSERVKCLLESKGCSITIPDVMETVDAFAEGAEQFDDITMMITDFKRTKDVMHSEGQTFIAGHEGHDEALRYIHSRLEDSGCSEKVMKDIELSSSEILANIDMYAYQGVDNGIVRVSADVVDRKAIVIFRDNGPEYNPLERSNPDSEKRIKEHKIGGFGIFIVKKLMDDVHYERSGDTNILTIIKEI